MPLGPDFVFTPMASVARAAPDIKEQTVTERDETQANPLRFKSEGGIARLTLNRADLGNAINLTMARTLMGCRRVRRRRLSPLPVGNQPGQRSITNV
jgi:hypothetical protein